MPSEAVTPVDANAAVGHLGKSTVSPSGDSPRLQLQIVPMVVLTMPPELEAFPASLTGTTPSKFGTWTEASRGADEFLVEQSEQI